MSALSSEFKLDDFISYNPGVDQISDTIDWMHHDKSIRSVIHFGK